MRRLPAWLPSGPPLAASDETRVVSKSIPIPGSSPAMKVRAHPRMCCLRSAWLSPYELSQLGPCSCQSDGNGVWSDTEDTGNLLLRKSFQHQQGGRPQANWQTAQRCKEASLLAHCDRMRFWIRLG